MSSLHALCRYGGYLFVSTSTHVQHNYTLTLEGLRVVGGEEGLTR